MPKKPKHVPAHKIAETIDAAVPLRAANVHTLAPVDVDRQAAMYEAHARGDTAEFERLRDEQ